MPNEMLIAIMISGGESRTLFIVIVSRQLCNNASALSHHVRKDLLLLEKLEL